MVRPEIEFNVDGLAVVARSKAGSSVLDPDDVRFLHLEVILNTPVRKERFPEAFICAAPGGEPGRFAAEILDIVPTV